MLLAMAKFIYRSPWKSKTRMFLRRKKPIGDIFKNSLEEIWNNEEMQLYRKKLLDNDYLDLCNSSCILGFISKESSLRL